MPQNHVQTHAQNHRQVRPPKIGSKKKFGPYFPVGGLAHGFVHGFAHGFGASWFSAPGIFVDPVKGNTVMF